MRRIQSIPCLELSTSEMYNIVAPELGLILYNTDEGGMVIFTNDGWKLLLTSPIYMPIFEEDWESGNFITNQWSVVNSSVNKWCVGQADSADGIYSAYISNDDGVSSAYTKNTTNISHLYTDIYIPANMNEVSLYFDFKGEGELSRDYMRVYIAPTTFTPTVNVLPAAPAEQVGNSQYNNKNKWNIESINLGVDFVGATMRLIFTWRNDNRFGTDPAAQIDNIIIKVL